MDARVRNNSADEQPGRGKEVTPAQACSRRMRAAIAAVAMSAISIGAVVVFAITPSRGLSRGDPAVNNCAALVAAINLYRADTGSLPDPANLGVLWERPTDPSSKGPWLENSDMLKDSWGRNFLLIVPGIKNKEFDVVSYGADGKPGGTGEEADIVKP